MTARDTLRAQHRAVVATYFARPPVASRALCRAARLAVIAALVRRRRH